MIPTTLIVQKISMINNSKESEIEIQNYRLETSNYEFAGFIYLLKKYCSNKEVFH
jgi:hypothetical protein